MIFILQVDIHEVKVVAEFLFFTVTKSLDLINEIRQFLACGRPFS
jgi:hypothetical protein